MRRILYQFTARVLSTDGPAVFQTGTVFVRAAHAEKAQRDAAKHVEDTWPCADPRVNYRVEISELQRCDETEERFNRPELVWTEGA